MADREAELGTSRTRDICYFTGWPVGEGGRDHLSRKKHLVLLTGCQLSTEELKKSQQMPTKNVVVKSEKGGESKIAGCG